MNIDTRLQTQDPRDEVGLLNGAAYALRINFFCLCLWYFERISEQIIVKNEQSGFIKMPMLKIKLIVGYIVIVSKYVL